MDPDITEKRKEIEDCLADLDGTKLEQWQNFAKSKGGLISGKSIAVYYSINVSFTSPIVVVSIIRSN